MVSEQEEVSTRLTSSAATCFCSASCSFSSTAPSVPFDWLGVVGDGGASGMTEGTMGAATTGCSKSGIMSTSSTPLMYEPRLAALLLLAPSSSLPCSSMCSNNRSRRALGGGYRVQLEE